MLLTAILTGLGWLFYQAMLDQNATYPIASAFMGTLMVCWVFCLDLWVPQVEQKLIESIRKLFNK
jgi:hypothetical protein